MRGRCHPTPGRRPPTASRDEPQVTRRRCGRPMTWRGRGECSRRLRRMDGGYQTLSGRVGQDLDTPAHARSIHDALLRIQLPDVRKH